MLQFLYLYEGETNILTSFLYQFENYQFPLWYDIGYHAVTLR